MEDPSITLQGWVPLLGILATLAVGLIPTIYNGMRADRNAARAARAAEKAAAATEQVAITLDEHNAHVDRKLDAIDTNTNGRLQKANEKIDRLEQRLFETEGIDPTGEDQPKPAQDSDPDDGPPEGSYERDM